jgi:hypothetical protein
MHVYQKMNNINPVKKLPKMKAISLIFIKVSKVNNHALGEKSLNLVTLLASHFAALPLEPIR